MPRLIQDIHAPTSYERRAYLARQVRDVHHATRLNRGRSVRPKHVAAHAPGTKHQWWHHRALDFAQYPLIAAAALAGAYSSNVGQLIILAFALLALAIRLSSRFSFGAAIFLLVCVPFFQILNMTGVSQNCAIYAYELLVVGTAQAVIELWKDNHRAAKTP